MGLVDVCTILRDNSEAAKRDRTTVKPVAVAEERESNTWPDLTKMWFQQGRLPNQKIRKPLLLMGSPIDSDGEDVRGLFSAIVPNSSLTEVRKGLLIEPTHVEDEDEETREWKGRWVRR